MFNRIVHTAKTRESTPHNSGSHEQHGMKQNVVAGFRENSREVQSYFTKRANIIRQNCSARKIQCLATIQ